MNEDEIIETIENDLKNVDLYGDTYDKKYAKLLDLYNKQKEQIKELEEDNKYQWEERCKMAIELDNDVIPKSKIKEKIEEWEKALKRTNYYLATYRGANQYTVKEGELDKEVRFWEDDKLIKEARIVAYKELLEEE